MTWFRKMQKFIRKLLCMQKSECDCGYDICDGTLCYRHLDISSSTELI
jgi:hypothetical protein